MNLQTVRGRRNKKESENSISPISPVPQIRKDIVNIYYCPDCVMYIYYNRKTLNIYYLSIMPVIIIIKGMINRFIIEIKIYVP